MRIVAQNLSYVYNKGAKFAVDALKGVSLTIESGDFFGIIGRTGSGKSTFVQHLNALILAQSGSLTVGEFDLLKQSKKDKAKFKELRKRVGMVFQYPEYQLFAETVFDDVAFGLKNFEPNLNKDEIERRVSVAIDRVGLNYAHVKNKSPFELSGGQKRRVAIAGVIVTEPEVLILDEPVAGLDPEGKKELWQLLHSLNNNGKTTIIVVSHDMNDVSENCSKIAVFSRGTVVACGSPKEVFSSAEVVRAGLDVPLTCYLTTELKKVGVAVDSNFTQSDFAKNIAKILKN